MPATAVADGSGLPNENTRRLRVLVAAYNPISRKLYRHALEADGYEVVECVDGGAALEASARQRPDLVIQELLLADGSGFELARRLRDLHSGVPIVGITGVAPVPAELFDDVLVKPVGPQRLVETVRALAPGQRPARIERGAGPPARPATGGAQDARRESLEGVLLSFAAALSDSFATSLDAELSLDDVLRALADATEIDRSAVFLSGDAGARVAASCGFRATEREMLDRLCAEGGLVDRCLAARKVLPVEDGLGLRSGRVAPLGSNARSAGAILLGSETLELGAEWDLFARGVGSHLGEALATSRLLARVAASEERYRSLLENANDGIVVLGSDGRVIEVNHRA